MPYEPLRKDAEHDDRDRKRDERTHTSRSLCRPKSLPSSRRMDLRSVPPEGEQENPAERNGDQQSGEQDRGGEPASPTRSRLS